MTNTKKIKLTFASASLGLVLWSMSNAFAGNVLVVANDNLGKLDSVTVQKIFTGKVIEVNGIRVTAINVKPGELRNRFLQAFLEQDEEKYTAYWTVRRYIGKGAPPREFNSAADVIGYIKETPGAIGYIDESDMTSGINVVSQ